MITTKGFIAAALLASLLSGCASLNPDPAFEDVKRSAAERVAAGEVLWERDDSARALIDARVAELLSRALTVESAVQVAFLRNRLLQAELAELGIAQAELVQAGLLQNPVLSADVRFGMGVSGTGADIGLVQEFLSILQIPLRKRVAAAELEVTKLEVGAEIFSLASEVKQAFFDAQGSEQMLELRRTVAEATAVAADIAQRQHDAGNITDLDLANERALYEEAKLGLADAEVELFQKRERLTRLLGLWGGEAQWTLSARLPALPDQDPKPEGLETLAVSNRLDLLAARQRIGVAATTVSLNRFYGLIPEGRAGVASERDLDGAWSLGPSIELPIPLFDQRQAQVAIARGRQRQNEERFAELAVSIRSDVRRAWAELDASRSRATYYERVLLPLRRTILDQTQREYNGMLVGVYQLLQAKRDEVEAGRAYIESLRTYWESRVELERALGTELPLSGGLPPASPAPEASTPAQAPPHPHHHSE